MIEEYFCSKDFTNILKKANFFIHRLYIIKNLKRCELNCFQNLTQKTNTTIMNS